MINRMIGIKLIVTLCFVGSLLTVVRSSSSQTKTKKQNMAEMREQFITLNDKMMSGAVTTKFTDQDFEEVSSLCDQLTGLANEYAQLESDQDLSAIATNMAANLEYLKQQSARKDSLVLVMTYGRLLSFCAECHYQTRWVPKEPEQPSSGQR